MKSTIHEHQKNNFTTVSKNVFLALLLFVGITAMAQEKKERRPEREKLTTEQKVDLQVKKMTQDLSLNDKQVKEVRAIVTKQVEKREEKRAEMEAKKAEMKIKKAEMKAKMTEEQAALTSEMKKVLTPEQFTKWEKIREEKKANVKEKMKERRGKKDSKELPKD